MMAEDASALEARPLERPSPREATLDDETRALVVPDAADLPASPPSAVEANFARYYISGKRLDFVTLDWCKSFQAFIFSLRYSCSFRVKFVVLVMLVLLESEFFFHCNAMELRISGTEVFQMRI